MPPVTRNVFILGTGRCGTTLLANLLNTHPDIHIEGEHGGFLNPIANAYWLLRGSKYHLDRLYTNGAPSWQTAFAERDAAPAFREFVASLVWKGVTAPIRGFKEIHYGNERALWFFGQVFPDALFVFIHRDPADTLASMARAWNGGRILEDHTMRVASATPVLRAWPGLHLEYERLDDAAVCSVFAALGLEAPAAALGRIAVSTHRGTDLYRDAERALAGATRALSPSRYKSSVISGLPSRVRTLFSRSSITAK